MQMRIQNGNQLKNGNHAKWHRTQPAQNERVRATGQQSVSR